MSLGADNGYPLESGALVSSEGLRAPVRDFEEHVVEEHVAHSNALHARFDGQLYVVGPLARYSLHADALSPLAAQVAHAAGLGPQCRNPFRSILVRTVELVYALDEAIRIIDDWPGCVAAVPVEVRPAWVGATEAPRGLLYHRYRVDGPARSLKRRSYPHISEPAQRGGRPAGVRTGPPRPASRCVDPAVRDRHPQLRSVHLLRDPLPVPSGGFAVKPLVVGLGSVDRGDDAVGVLVVRQVADVPGADVIEVSDPSRLVDLGAGRDVMVLVDAVSSGSAPGTVRGGGRGPGPTDQVGRGKHALGRVGPRDRTRAGARHAASAGRGGRNRGGRIGVRVGIVGAGE